MKLFMLLPGALVEGVFQSGQFEADAAVCMKAMHLYETCQKKITSS